MAIEGTLWAAIGVINGLNWVHFGYQQLHFGPNGAHFGLHLSRIGHILGTNDHNLVKCDILGISQFGLTIIIGTICVQLDSFCE